MSTPYRDPPERESRRDEPSELEQKLAAYARVGVPALTIVIALLAGIVQGPASAILVLAGGALVGVIAVFWASVRTLLGETPLSGADAYALAAPRSEEEQKRAILRALKDLEFERSVGKISEEDYQELTGRYRAEAKRLLRLIDEEGAPRRERVEAIVAKRLRREGLTGPGTGSTTAADSEKPAEEKGSNGKPAAKKGSAKKAAQDRLAAEKLAAEKPEGDEASDDEAASAKPTRDESDDDAVTSEKPAQDALADEAPAPQKAALNEAGGAESAAKKAALNEAAGAAHKATLNEPATKKPAVEEDAS